MATSFEILQLPDIFLLFRAPYILQSDNGSEFAAEVINELKIIWPKLVLIHGKPRHPQSQGSVVAWMEDNNTTNWSIGIKFVQFQKNSSLHAGIRRSPYAAMFGCEAKVGLTMSSLPDEVIQRMQCEDDMLAVLTTGQNGEEPGPVPSAESAEVNFDTERASPENGLSRRENNIIAQRKGAHTSQLTQAERKVKRSRIDLAAGEPLDNAAVPIPLVHRGRGDPRNILGVVL
ncbi:KRAB-A domain-containing protein 2-like [Penaeus indicus]|uniref:KRAB-A domain-containing protein 2-like n=1 Tax=Penaeus indicus TaxID=29960 RepID=UPI00300C4432